ncbi:Nudix family hydrolase [Stutzerimonas azotifigens]|uniref:8-oxo-dGTP diphosphatase n=1 Tax=Stutzerimonas azotifigens TaxID=291995 RepID=A0ABR5Z7G3_9GAMM|nr:Nudix family hydrolase [Stutzerimonas azotifigens]MBA1276037.1 Nudix family hydrolase [Stutzerimonas azotifigens]
MKRVHVAAAVIRGAEGRVLIAKRPEAVHQGGLWEFPGGKVEFGETVRDALVRELREELAIEVSAARRLIQIRHDYPDKHVLLDVWEVTRFEGEPQGAEGQPLAWVAPDELPGYAFPAANQPIITAARLPDRYLITPDDVFPDALLAGVDRALEQGITLIQLRAPALSAADYRELASEVLEHCAGRAKLLLKGPLDWCDDFSGAGWHLTARQLKALAGCEERFRPPGWLAASCHDAEELALADRLGVDFVTLSPVSLTLSHPEATPLGWSGAAQLLAGFNKPAYLLGGLTLADTEQAREAGAQGLAAIRGLWPG